MSEVGITHVDLFSESGPAQEVVISALTEPLEVDLLQRSPVTDRLVPRSYPPLVAEESQSLAVR